MGRCFWQASEECTRPSVRLSAGHYALGGLVGIRLGGCEGFSSCCLQELCVIWGFVFRDVGRIEQAQRRRRE